MPIQFIDLKILDPTELPTVNKLANEYFSKFERDLKNPTLIVHFKKYRELGRKSKYSIECRIDSPHLICSSNAHDWDLARTLHKVFRKIEQEIRHKFKTEGKPRERIPRNKRLPLE